MAKKTSTAPIYGDQNVGNLDDDINGTNQSDYIFAYLGDDDVRGGNGNDKIEGGYGDDKLEGNNGKDTLYGDNFTAYTATVVDPLTESYDDELDGGNGKDELYGMEGSDWLEGGNGKDKLYGDDGDDILYGGKGKDILDGGEGSDTVSYEDAANKVSVNLATGTVKGNSEGKDTLIDIENVIGSSAADTLLGSDDANVLDGNDGNDNISGGLGDDTLIGGDDADTLTGGDGMDIFVFDSLDAADTVTDFASGADMLSFDDSTFTSFGGLTFGAGNFVDGTTALDADDFLLYDSSSGALYYDADGNGAGAAVVVVQMGAGTAVAYTDIVIS